MTEFEDFWVKVGSEEEFSNVLLVLKGISYRPNVKGTDDNYASTQGYVHCWNDGEYTSTNTFSGECMSYHEFMHQYGNTHQQEQQPMSTQYPLLEGISIVYKDKQGNAHDSIEEAVEANKKREVVDGFIDDVKLFTLALQISMVGESDRIKANIIADWLLKHKQAVLKLYGMGQE